MTKLILVRHGETEANAQQVWQGSLDAPLTARGQQQVAATANYLCELVQRCPIDRFYVSPLPRAQSTARAIAQVLQLEPTIEPGLREFDLGDWEGRSFRELKEKEQLWQRWRIDPTFAPPNGESPRTFGRRAVSIMATLAAAHPGQTILVVTHGGLICNVLATWLGGGPDEWAQWDPHNCAISILHLVDQRWQGLAVNAITHLPPEAIVTEKPAYAEE